MDKTELAFIELKRSYHQNTLIPLWVHWFCVQVKARLTNIWAQMHNTGWVWQKTASSFMWNQPEGKKKKSQNQWTRTTVAKPTKTKQQKRADLKTRKEKYQVKQNVCAANNTGVFHFHTKSSFQQNSKIKLNYIYLYNVKMNSKILWVHG